MPLPDLVPLLAQAVAVPEPSAEAVRYYRSGNVLWVIGTALSLLIPALFLFSGWSARLRDLARRLARQRWLPTVAIYAVLFTLATSLVESPFVFYADFVREHRFGLSNQSFASWLREAALGLGVGCVLAALGLWIPYLLLRRSPRRWWLWSGLATIPVLLLLSLVGPVWIDPLFDDFGRLEDPALERRILALADRVGIETDRVWVVDKAADTRKLNAYVAGVGRTQRIVLWNTLLESHTPDEVVAVVGHEMGHYVLRHVLWGVLATALLATLAAWVVHRLAGALLARWHRRFGFTELADPASLPLLLLLGGTALLVVSPAALALSRHFEREADRFGLALTGDGHAAATSFVKLLEGNLAVPWPSRAVVLLRYTHPPLGERIEFANEWD